MTRIICLANSWKRSNRCIAGIHTITGKWVRAISRLPDGSVTPEMRLVDQQEPALLDVLDIPLEKTGVDFGFESENLSILPGKWQRKEQVPPGYLQKYCSKEPYILHNDQPYVSVAYLQSLPARERKTLQLVKAIQFSAQPVFKRFEGGQKWKGTLLTETNQQLTATITDPVFVRKLELGYRPTSPCLVTVSLSLPWKPHDWEKEDDPCWKLIAGVVELSHHSSK